MPDNVLNQSACRGSNAPQTACIHTSQITDSCLDKDCIEDLRVYLTRDSQNALSRASGTKCRCAELVYADIDVEPLSYRCGHYCVDITFYYRVIGDVFADGARPTAITGIAVFNKRCVLYCNPAKARSFRSTDAPPTKNTILECEMPVAVVEVLDPIILAAKVKEVCDCRCCEVEAVDIPAGLTDWLGEDLVLSGETKRLYVSIGQFSTVRLERDAQLTIPTSEYCIPTRECGEEECAEEDPCELFSRIDFPVSSFYPEECTD